MKGGSIEDVVSALLDASLQEWLSLLGTILAIGLVLRLIFRIRGWCRDDMGPTEAKQQMLPQLAELHRLGHLTDEEYRSIKGQMVVQTNSTSAVGSSQESVEKSDADSDQRSSRLDH